MNNLFQPIVNFFRIILEFFFAYTHDWGWSIVLLTVLIKMVLFPTTIKQFQVMNKMKMIQPKLKEIQDKYKDKPEEFQRRTMEMYKTEKVNPFGSCLPMLLQIPLLIAIFALLQDKAMLAKIGDARFLWFGLQDRDIILAIISGVTTFIQTKLTTPATGTASDSSQQIFLYIMPVMFAYFTYTVNAGVAIYWVVSNLVGIAQQYLINEFFIVKEHLHKHDDKTQPEK